MLFWSDRTIHRRVVIFGLIVLNLSYFTVLRLYLSNFEEFHCYIFHANLSPLLQDPVFLPDFSVIGHERLIKEITFLLLLLIQPYLYLPISILQRLKLLRNRLAVIWTVLDY